MGPRIIVLNQHRDDLELVRNHLITAGFTAVDTLSDSSQAATRFESEPVYDVALVEVGMAAAADPSLIEVIRKNSPNTECIMIIPSGAPRTALGSLRKGAYESLAAPFGAEDLMVSVRRALERKRLLDVLYTLKCRHAPAVEHPVAFRKIITRCSALLRVLKEAELHAASDAPILITGERGTGKELLARAIHDAGPWTAGPFRAVSAADLNDASFASELCGGTDRAPAAPHKKTEGERERRERGTLFLKDIDKLPGRLQERLLRELQDGAVSARGIGRPKIDARLIAASDSDMDSVLTAGGLRRDFFAWVRGSWLHLPPIRERGEDIALLIDHFLEARCLPGAECRLEERARRILLAHDFPGNADELQFVMQTAVDRAQGKVITAK